MLSDDAFREQLLDYLYGGLDGAALAEFERALDESPARRAELAAMRATLTRARAGLAALSDDPPARLRTAVLDEARRSEVARGRARVRRSVAHRSAIAWLVPALSVAAAVAFLVLRQGDDAAAPMQRRDASERAPAPSVPPATAPGAAPEPASADEARPPQAAPAPPRAAPARRRAAPLSPQKGAGERREEREGLGGAGLGSSGAVRARSPARSADMEEAPAAREAVQPAPAAAQAERKTVAAARAPDARVTQADELAREGRRAEAAAAYRALLAHYPDDPRRETWRARLTDLTAPPR